MPCHKKTVIRFEKKADINILKEYDAGFCAQGAKVAMPWLPSISKRSLIFSNGDFHFASLRTEPRHDNMNRYQSFFKKTSNCESLAYQVAYNEWTGVLSAV